MLHKLSYVIFGRFQRCLNTSGQEQLPGRFERVSFVFAFQVVPGIHSGFQRFQRFFKVLQGVPEG